MPSALPTALVRHQLRFRVNRAEIMLIESKAREAGLSVGNYVRSKLGLPERSVGRPTLDQLEVEQDQAWEIIRSLGEDPADYFPPDDEWMEGYR